MDSVVEKIVRARIAMLFKAPFFGTLAIRLKIVNASAWCPTMGTDGRHLYYNEEFVNKLNSKQLIFVIAHEVLHCVYDHMNRRGGRHPKIWNYANDYVINLEIRDQRIGEVPGNDIGILLDDRYREMCSEEVYDKLMEDHKGQLEELLKMLEKGSFDVHMDGNAGDGDEDGEQGECPTCGGSGKDPKDPTKDCEDCDGTGKDKSGAKGRIPMTKDERDMLKDEIRQAVMQASKAAGAGNTPAGVRRLIKEITEAQMDWRELLNTSIQSVMKSDYTFMRPSRKSVSTGCYLPGMKNDETIDVSVCIDTSGSMSDQMLRDFVGEVRGIMEQFTDFKLMLWFFDTEVYTIHTFSAENIEEIDTVQIEGGGGTMFECNWEFMKEEGIIPEQFVVFTDGYPCGTWGDEYYCDTLFVIHGARNITAPFGMTVHYDHPEADNRGW